MHKFVTDNTHCVSVKFIPSQTVINMIPGTHYSFPPGDHAMIIESIHLLNDES